MHYVETIFGPAIAKYTTKIGRESSTRESDSYNDTNISTTQKQETDDNDVKPELKKINTTTTTDDEQHHIEVIDVGTHIRPEVEEELNHTLWKNVNMTVLDAIMQTWLLNLDHKDKPVETEIITTTEHLSGTVNPIFNVTYTNVSIYTTENPIHNKAKEMIKINTFTESPLSGEMLINLEDGIIRRKKSNNSYVSKNVKKGLPKLNLSEISNASESDEEFPVKINATQTLHFKDNIKGVTKSSPKHVTKLVLPTDTTVFTTKADIVTTTTDMSTKSHVIKNKKKVWPTFQDLDSTDVSQVSEETLGEPLDDLKSFEHKYVKKGLMSFQPESDIVHNFLYLSTEEMNEDSRTIEVSEKIFKNKNIKKGLSNLIHIQQHETTTEKTEQDIPFESEATEQYTIKVTTDKVTATTEEYLTVTTEKITNTTEQLFTGITKEEVTQNDESSTKLNNLAENLMSTTDIIEHLEVGIKGVERSIEDAEEKSEDSFDSEKEQVVVYT